MSSPWLKRFSVHLAAAVGATGIFVTAAAVGASQTRQQAASTPSVTTAASRTRTPAVERRPSAAAAASSTPAAAASATSTSARVAPERSVAGTIQEVLPDQVVVLGVGGREWHVAPAPGALIRLNGRGAKLDDLAAGDTLVILGQVQSARGSLFLAHAITARRR